MPKPEKRLGMLKVKKHPFFEKIEWQKAYDGELKMPKVALRKVVKSDLPYSYDKNEDSEEEDDYFEERKEESFVDERPL